MRPRELKLKSTLKLKPIELLSIFAAKKIIKNKAALIKGGLRENGFF